MPGKSHYRYRLVKSIETIGKAAWERCAGSDYPFTRYEFLHALEVAGGTDAACTAESGWQPSHLVVEDAGRGEYPIAAVLPLYAKQHSYGEYIFDWAWAEAYIRNGLAYYPKLLAAIPFTPATGPRLLVNSDYTGNGRAADIAAYVAAQVPVLCEQAGASSFHLLYPGKDEAMDFARQPLFLRHSFQYHWFNRDQDGQVLDNFEDWCGTLKSRKRKSILRERRDVASQDIQIERMHGEAISPSLWREFFTFYQVTYARRSGHGGYLPCAFFEDIGQRMPEQVMMVVARKRGQLIAAALNFYSSTNLFGRYWGCIDNAEFLHFELCYYQGIEFCLERGLERFDAGAQGEHKIQRGFVPIDTWSVHWIAREDFRRAIKHYVEQERQHNQRHMDAAMRMLPFRSQPT